MRRRRHLHGTCPDRPAPRPPNPVFSAWCTPSQGPTLIDACVVAQAAQPTIESADDGSMTISTNGTLPGQTKATCLVLAPHSSPPTPVECFPHARTGVGFSISLRQGAHALSSRVRVRGCMVGYARVCAGVRHGRAPPRVCVCVCVCDFGARALAFGGTTLNPLCVVRFCVVHTFRAHQGAAKTAGHRRRVDPHHARHADRSRRRVLDLCHDGIGGEREQSPCQSRGASCAVTED